MKTEGGFPETSNEKYGPLSITATELRETVIDKRIRTILNQAMVLGRKYHAHTDSDAVRDKLKNIYALEQGTNMMGCNRLRIRGI